MQCLFAVVLFSDKCNLPILNLSNQAEEGFKHFGIWVDYNVLQKYTLMTAANTVFSFPLGSWSGHHAYQANISSYWFSTRKKTFFFIANMHNTCFSH